MKELTLLRLFGKMERYHVSTGDQGPIHKRIEEFFEEIMEKIGIRKDRPSEFEKRLYCPVGKSAEYEIVTLDDKLHMLLYKEQVVAVVTETRTDSNFIQFDFFKNIEDLVK